MLSQLFGSEARVKILNIFLTKPEGRYYLRQLARDLELQVNSVRRELLNLEKLGLIIPLTGDSKAKEKKYYAVNRDFLLFNEIKALFIKARLLSTQEFTDNVQKICTPKLFLLAGFFVGNNDSKTDILLIGRVNHEKFSKLIKDLERAVNREINYTIMDEKEFAYRQELFDIFTHGLLEGKKIVVCDNRGLDHVKLEHAGDQDKPTVKSKKELVTATAATEVAATVDQESEKNNDENKTV